MTHLDPSAEAGRGEPASARPSPTKTPGGAVLRLLRQSGLYALGSIVVKLSGFLLHLLYLDETLLTQRAYGYLVLIETTAQLGVVVAGLGLGTGLLKFIADEAYAGRRAALPFTALVTTVVSVSVFGGVAWLLSPDIARVLLDSPDRAVLVQLLVALVAARVVAAVPMTMLRSLERAGLYVAALGVEAVLTVGGVYVALAVLQAGLVGVLTAWVVAATGSALVLVTGLLVRVPWRLEGGAVPRLLRFGVPLAFAGLASLFLRSGDQYLLKAFTGAAEVALYGWAYKLGGMINMLFVQSFNMAFAVVGLKHIGADRANTGLHRTMFRHYVIWTGWGVVGLALLTPDVTRLVADSPAYLTAAPLVVPIGIGFLCYGLYFIVLNVLYAAERTRSIAGLVGAAALLNALLNLVAIPWLGAYGAAVTSAVSYAALMGATAVLAEREIRVRYPWSALARVLVLVVGLYALAQPVLSWSLAWRLAGLGGLILLYPALVLAVRLYTLDDLRALPQWIRSRRQRGPTPGDAAG